jgi:hypothetical protein
MRFLNYINEQISTQELKEFENKWLAKLKPYGLTNFEFSNHVGKLRLNDDRNKPELDIKELDFVMEGFLKKFGPQLKKDIEDVKNHTARRRGKNKNDIPENNLEYVIKSKKTGIALILVLKQDFGKKGTAVILPATVIRKRAFVGNKGEEIMVERKVNI